jgi:group I intron endonuclease
MKADMNRETIISLSVYGCKPMQDCSNIGVYAIVNKENNKVYIGSTVRKFRKRFQCHKADLNKGTHHSEHLQRAWRTHGPDAFEFLIVEYVTDKFKVLEREQYYLDTIKPEYNNAPVAGSSIGVKHTEQARRNMSVAQKRLLAIPEYKERRLNALREVLATQESKQHRSKIQSQPHLVEIRSKASSLMWQQEGFKQKNIEAMKVANAKPEVKARKSEIVRRRNIEKSSITKDVAMAIYDALQQGVKGQYLAKQYGVGASSISRIKARQHWAFL